MFMNIVKLYIINILIILVSLFFVYLYGYTDVGSGYIGLGPGLGYFVIAFCILIISCLIFLVLTILLLFEIAVKRENCFCIDDLKIMYRIKICQLIIMISIALFLHKVVYVYISFIMIGILTSALGLRNWFKNAPQKELAFVTWLLTTFPVLDIIIISLIKR